MVLLDSTAHYMFDKEFYLDEFEKLDVEPGNQILLDEVLDFLEGDSELISFSDRETQHMHDVKSLVDKGYIIFFSLIAIFVAGMAYLRSLNAVKKTLMYTSFMIIGFSVLAIASGTFFSELFVAFHKLLFTNDLWMLPADSLLITMFPEQFFIDITAAIIMRCLLMALVMLWIVVVLMHVRDSRQAQSPGL